MTGKLFEAELSSFTTFSGILTLTLLTLLAGLMVTVYTASDPSSVPVLVPPITVISVLAKPVTVPLKVIVTSNSPFAAVWTSRSTPFVPVLRRG